MNHAKLLGLGIFLLIAGKLSAKGPSALTDFKEANANSWSFTENKGQLGPNSNDIKYYSHSQSVNVFCRPGVLHFVTFYLNESRSINESDGKAHLNETQIKTAQIDLILQNSNPNAEITASDQQSYYENYFTSNTPTEGITNIYTYKTIIYKNIYHHIDMVLHTAEAGMKYEFVVFPGGKVSDIQLQWNGVHDMALAANGGIHYGANHIAFNESKPVTFQIENKSDAIYASASISNNQTQIASAFKLQKHTISFEVGAYDHDKTLVIDPFLDWSTYMGGKEVDEAAGIAVDNMGNVYTAGITKSAENIADLRSFQLLNAGGFDGFIAKYNSLGQRLWSTYFGGKGRENVAGIALDAGGNIFIAGSTSSNADMASPGAWQSDFQGNMNGSDGFIARFSTNGSRDWCTYFGGGSEETSGITLDFMGNVFITGTTGSSDHIASNDAWQPLKSGSNDAFIAKFSNSGSRIWSSYFGGNESDNAFGITTDIIGNVLITGQTYSSEGIASPGFYHQNHTVANNYADAFIAKFSGSGQRIWSGYFGGNLGATAKAITIDPEGNYYITGFTESTSGIATPGAYQMQYGYAGDAFIASFNQNGLPRWSTYFGGDGDDKANAIKTDLQGNIYICGNAGSNTGIAANGGWQMNFGGGCNDAYLASFTQNGQLLWSTYYGNRGSEVAYGLAIDNASNIYMCGVTNSGSNMSTPGAYQILDAGKLDGFLVKYKMKDVHVNSITVDHTGNNATFTGPQIVTITLKNHGNIPIDAAKINWTVNGNPQPEFSWSGHLMPDATISVAIGNIKLMTARDTIKAWATLSQARRYQDPDCYIITDTFLAPPNPHFTIKPLSFIINSFRADDTTLSVYNWSFGDGTSAENIRYGYKPVHSYPKEDTYLVSLTVNGKNGYPYQFDTLINAKTLNVENLELANFKLSVFPNPFQTSTAIEYTLSKSTNMTMSLFDISGKQIGLINNQIQNAGSYKIDINAEKYSLNAGIYLLKCVVDGQIITKHLVYGGF